VGVLYIVATPIGNLEDVTLRALRILGEADLVLAEDTRRTRVLLDRHLVKARPRSLHAHNERSRSAEVLEVLEGEGTVALVSDAGTPLVSDPGELLVAAAVEAGHRVEAVPGPSALLTALVASGISAERFSFLGFPPRRAGALRRFLREFAERDETLVFFESPNRLGTTLALLAEIFGERRACVARELTKLHEELVRGSLSELAERFREGARGECTIVVEGAPAPQRLSADELDRSIAERSVRGERPREIAEALAKRAGLPKRQVYARVLALRSSNADNAEDAEDAD